MKLAKIVILVAVAVLLTATTALAEALIITIDSETLKDGSQGPITIRVNGNQNTASGPATNAAVPVGDGIDTATRTKMNDPTVGMSKLKDSGMIVISNPCAWVYIGGKWYWRCW